MEHFLTPVLALIIWTFVMWAVMYKRRIPAMRKITPNIQDFIENPSLKDQMPSAAINAADNYNHLHEQPTIFYALMFYISLTGGADKVFFYLACAYVVLRVIHSLIQVTVNQVMPRFTVFALSSIVLIVMSLRAAAALFAG